MKTPAQSFAKGVRDAVRHLPPFPDDDYDVEAYNRGYEYTLANANTEAEAVLPSEGVTIYLAKGVTPR